MRPRSGSCQVPCLRTLHNSDRYIAWPGQIPRKRRSLTQHPGQGPIARDRLTGCPYIAWTLVNSNQASRTVPYVSFTSAGKTTTDYDWRRRYGTDTSRASRPEITHTSFLNGSVIAKRVIMTFLPNYKRNASRYTLTKKMQINISLEGAAGKTLIPESRHER